MSKQPPLDPIKSGDGRPDLRQLVRVRRQTNQSHIYRQTADIQRRQPERQTLSGQLINDWTNVETLLAISCAIAPVGGLAKQDARGDIDSATITHHISFQHQHVSILETDRVVVHHRGHPHIYNIVGVEHDSHGTTTRINAEIVRVGSFGQRT